MMLVFLLCIGTAAIGISTVSAKEYGSGDVIEVGSFYPGDTVSAGTKLVQYLHFKARVYFDDELLSNCQAEYVFDRPGVLKKVNGYPTKNYYLTSLQEKAEVDSEETLKEAAKVATTIDLASDIVMETALEITDGKTHTINTNGYSLTNNDPNRSSIVVGDGSTLICKGTGNEYDSRLSEGKANKGGIIFVSGGSKVVLQGMAVTNNYAEMTGGGIYVEGGTLEMTDCIVRDNTSKANGGGITVAEEGKLIMNGTTVTKNKADNGGGVWVTSHSTAELTKCTFEGNSVSGNGGGLLVDEGSTATLTDCTFEANSAKDGGGVVNDRGTVTINNCKLNNNTVTGGGGGIWSKGKSTLTDTEITGNTNAVNGGGVTNHDNITLTGCTISGNNASNMGGGIYIDTNGKTELTSCAVSGNAAKDGGGIDVLKGSLVVTSSKLENNSAGTAGGGMWANSGSNVTFTKTSMTNNTCKTNGGCLNSHGDLSLNDCTITRCIAENSGGGIYMDTNGKLTLQNTQITGCTAGTTGGGINFYAGTLVLPGGKTFIFNNTVNGSANNIYFRVFNPIQVTGAFVSGSLVGFVPPDNGNQFKVTTGYSQFNKDAPYTIFHSDTIKFRVKRDGNPTEAQLERYLDETYNGYKIRVHIRVTNDVNYWDWAHLYIYGRDGRGTGDEKHINTSGDFHDNIDGEGREYDYEYDCGENTFPTRVDFTTKFGLALTWRGLDVEITVYINGVNVGNKVCVHNVYGVETLTSNIYIGGDKYPYPDFFDVDAPAAIEGSGDITIAAVDQYGAVWRAGTQNTTMENISFPGEDTFAQADNTGLKWTVSSTHKSNHLSVYEITFKSASNVYPKITKSFNVNFAFPLELNVIVNGETVLKTTGYRGDNVSIKDIKAPVGYIIKSYTREGVCILDRKDTNNYDFTFVTDSVTLTADLKPIVYTIEFSPNGPVNKGTMSTKSPKYDVEITLPKNKFKRDGYTFVGWNTQSDGLGTMYKDKAAVKNLTANPDMVVTLFAIWKPVNATTGSIFSDGSVLIYIGIGVLLASIIGAVIYSARKKKHQLTENTE